MPLAQRLGGAKTVESRQGPPCSVAVLLQTLPPEDAKALQDALDDPSVRASDLYLAIRAEGHYVGQQTVARHRSGRCRCAQ